MNIIETQEQPKFKPVTVVFESAEELQYVTKLLSIGSNAIYEKFTGDDSSTAPNYKMYSSLYDTCTKLGIEVRETNNTYIATY